MGQIFGIIAAAAAPDLGVELTKIGDHLNFWQADRQDRYVDSRAAIGNRLLFNTPESVREQLPLRCPDNRYVLSCVARLDNRRKLAELLNYDAATAAQAPDGQFMLDAFLRWKENCIHYFTGDFAVAVWDNLEKTLFLARDHIGVKPLFYSRTEDFFLFASDINAFKTHCRLEKNINKLYLARLLANTPNPVQETCYHNVVRLLPAHYYILKEGELTSTRYWSLEADNSHGLKTEEEYYTRFRELLYESVRCRLRTPGNIGCELSGGLDSSAITMLSARLLKDEPERLHTFSYVMPDEAKDFDDEWVDEEPEQEAVIDAGNILRANVHKIRSAYFDDPVEEMDYSTEVHAGISDSDSYWTEALRRCGKDHGVTVMFSGFPGDELVSASGGAWYFDLIARKEYKTILSLIREKPLERIKGVLAYFRRKYIHNPQFKDLIAQQKRSDLLSPHFDLPKEYRRRHTFTPHHKKQMSEKLTRPHTCLRMESEGLYALRNRMETRYPLADIRLLEFVLGIPSIFNKDAPQSRHLFRKATEGILPDKVRLRQNKKGAPLVFHQYKFYKDQSPLLKQFHEPEALRGILNTSKLLAIVQDHLKKKRHNGVNTTRVAFCMARFLRIN